MIHDYSTRPNWFNPARVTLILSATFLSPDADKRAVSDAVYAFLEPFSHIDETMISSDELKSIKKTQMSYVTDCIKKGRCNNRYFQTILDNEPDRERALNIIVSLARWPEWYLFREAELDNITRNLDKHLNEINAITYMKADNTRICPYDKDVYHNDMDLYKTIKAQSKAVEEYCQREEISSRISADDIISCLKDLEKDINDNNYRDAFEKGFFDAVHAVRESMPEVVDQMRRYRDGNATQGDFSRAETRSVVSDYSPPMKLLNLLGWHAKTCPNVLANIFHGRYPTIGLRKQDGQLQLDYDLEYFAVAAGLGPALKIRYVFNTSVEIQNFLSPMARAIQIADKEYDPLCEAYNDQLYSTKLSLPRIKDAYCVDATGYSDYLFRGVYKWLLEIYKVPTDIIDNIMAILRMPLKINGKLYFVEFGSMQGCKLLVFIMNHANRLIGIIAHRLDQSADLRVNCGDDVTTFNFNSEFREQTVLDELKVFSWFNCAINRSKTAWLQRDGYFDYCSKYFCRSGDGCISISGIPPKLLGKEMVSIKSFTEIFRVLDSSLTAHNPLLQVWEDCKDLLRPELEYGCNLPNSLGIRWNVEDKIAAALEMPTSVGGLLEDREIDGLIIAQHIKVLLERLLQNFRFQARGVFLVLQGLRIEGTELYKALGSVESYGLAPVLDIIQDLKMAEFTGVVEEDLLDRARMMLIKIDKCIINGVSISSTRSTYHRITAKRDIDTLLNDELTKADTPLVDSIAKPASVVEMALFIEAAKQDMTDVDKLRQYIRGRNLIATHQDRLVQETHGLYTNWYLIDDDKKRLKLTTEDRDLGPNLSGSYKRRADVINKDIGLLYDMLVGRYDIINDLSTVINGYFESAVVERLALYIEELRKDYINDLRRDYVRELTKDLIHDQLIEMIKR